MAVGARIPQAAPAGAGSVAGSRWHRRSYAERGVACPLPALARLRAAVSVAVIGVEVPFHGASRQAQDQLAHARLEGVVIRIVSCDLDHIAPGTQPIHFSRTFVGTQGCTAERRCLSCCLGSPYGIDADQCLFRIISFLR